MLKRPDLERLKKKLLKEYEEALDRRIAEFPPDRPLSIDEIEEIAQALRQEMGRRLAEELSKATARGCDRSRHPQKHPCPSCKRQARYRGKKPRTIVSMVGEFPIPRRIYYCERCDQCVAPIDQELRLPEHSYTVRVERMVARACAQSPFEQAVGDVERLTGVQVSAKEAQRITQAAGEYVQQVVKADVKKALRDPEAVAQQRHDPKVLIYVLLDGIHTPLRKCWKESKVGAVCVVDERGGRRVYYTHHLGGPKDIGEQLYALAARLGMAECARVVALGDGAPWIWRQIRQRFPHAVQILDWFHASEHIHAVARACFGVAEGEATAEMTGWVDAAIQAMNQAQTDTLIQHIRSLPAPGDTARAMRRKTIAYLQKNREKMNYPEYEKKGWAIGSGQIESGCKQVVGARMKGAGMRWKEPMAKAVGALRALLLSHRLWDQIMGAWSGRGMPPATLSPVPSF